MLESDIFTPERNNTYLEKLLDTDVVQDINLNRDKEGEPRILKYNYGHIVESVLRQLIGSKAEVSCNSCRRIAGPFLECIVSELCGSGAYASCHYNSEGYRCNYRTVKGTSPTSPMIEQSRRPEKEGDNWRRRRLGVRFVFGLLSLMNT